MGGVCAKISKWCDKKQNATYSEENPTAIASSASQKPFQSNTGQQDVSGNVREDPQRIKSHQSKNLDGQINENDSEGFSQTSTNEPAQRTQIETVMVRNENVSCYSKLKKFKGDMLNYIHSNSKKIKKCVLLVVVVVLFLILVGSIIIYLIDIYEACSQTSVVLIANSIKRFQVKFSCMKQCFKESSPLCKNQIWLNHSSLIVETFVDFLQLKKDNSCQEKIECNATLTQSSSFRHFKRSIDDLSTSNNGTIEELIKLANEYKVSRLQDVLECKA